MGGRADWRRPEGLRECGRGVPRAGPGAVGRAERGGSRRGPAWGWVGCRGGSGLGRPGPLRPDPGTRRWERRRLHREGCSRSRLPPPPSIDRCLLSASYSSAASFRYCFQSSVFVTVGRLAASRALSSSWCAAPATRKLEFSRRLWAELPPLINANASRPLRNLGEVLVLF